MDEELKQFLLGWEERLTANIRELYGSIERKIGSFDDRLAGSEGSLYWTLHRQLREIAGTLDRVSASMEATEATLAALPDDAFSVDKLPDLRNGRGDTAI